MLHSSQYSDDSLSSEPDEGAPARGVEFARDSVKRVRPSLVYRLGIGAVAATVLVLPLLYASLVLGLIAALVSFARLHFPESAQYPSLLMYAAVLLAGGAVVAFLLKPLFASTSDESTMLELQPGEQARLEKLVADLCGIVSAPMPARIAVDCAVNASVSFRHGLRSLFGGDLILVIGLPLVRNLDARSFAGVIAHEMGHFSQGAGMRLTYVIRRLNGWFHRAVYHRDEWDRWLRQGARGSRLGLLFQLAQLGIWCARRILFVLMLVGQAVSCFILRRMEFDADYYEICVAGTDGFRETTERIALLHEATVAARATVDESLGEGRLPDDLPQLISRMAGMTSSAAHSRIARRMTMEGGRLLDTHPTDWERIGRALELREEGIVIDGKRPAAEIFDEIRSLSRRATIQHFAVATDAESLGRVEWILAEQLANAEERCRELEQAADRFAGCRLEIWDASIRAVSPSLNSSDDVAALKRKLRKLTRSFNGSAARCGKIARAIGALDSDYSTSLKGKELIAAGYSLDNDARTRVAGGLGHRTELAQLREELAEFQALASERLGLVFSLQLTLQQESGAGRGIGAAGSSNSDYSDSKNLPAVLTFLEACSKLQPTVVRLRELLLRQTILIQHIEPGRDGSFEFLSRFQANAVHLRIAHCDLLSAMDTVIDPMSISQKSPESVGQWLRSSLSVLRLSDDPVFRGFQESSEALRKLGVRYRQVLGVAAIAVFETEERLQAAE
ncbi:MAG: M48 family metalloprotease [Verrucomicrobia bacterium]|nr:M48 family metalloprotease [Verrucomicrobiota bacterium]